MSRESFSRDDRDTTSHTSKLPPLHEILGDVLDQSSSRRGSVESRRSQSSFDHERAYSDLSHHQRSNSNYGSGAGYPSSPSTSSSYPSSRTPHPDLAATEAPGYSFHLFNLIPNQGLVHQRSSARDDLDPSTPKPRLPATDPARKYACAECGNRFSKQSTLRNHLLTHTGERPFACSHPGCGRRFSMACNMQRHMRTHTPASAFEIEEDDGLTQHTSRNTSVRGGSVSREHSVSRGGSPHEWQTGSRYSSSGRQ